MFGLAVSRFALYRRRARLGPYALRPALTRALTERHVLPSVTKYYVYDYPLSFYSLVVDP